MLSRGLAVALLCACAAAPQAVGPAKPQASAADVVYDVTVRVPDVIRVVARVTAAAAAEGLRLPLDWEGRGGLDDNITIESVRVGGADVAHRIERWTLLAEGGGDWEIRYRVGTRDKLNPATDGLPILAEEYLLTSGHPLFLFPKIHAESEAGNYRVDLQVEGGWKAQTSWAGSSIQGLRALQGALITAGDWRVHESSGLKLLLRGTNTWPDEDLTRTLFPVVSQARSLFSGSGDPLTLVIAPWERPRTTVAHTVDRGSLIVVSSEFDPGGPDDLSFVAREVAQIWLDGVIRHGPDAVHAGLWFREGVARYYGTLLPVRAGQYPSRALERLQDGIVNEFLRSPVKDATLYDLEQWYWDDPRIFEYVARKGALGAFLLDVELRGDGKSLDGFIQRMQGRFSSGERYSRRDLAEELSDYAGRDVGPFIEDHMIGTEPIPVADRLRAVGLAVSPAREQYPDYGVGWRVSAGARVLEGVRQEGAAHRAGCREGDLVSAYSVPRGRFAVEAVISAVRGGKEHTFRFFPDRSERDILMLRANSAEAQKIVGGIVKGR